MTADKVKQGYPRANMIPWIYSGILGGKKQLELKHLYRP